MEKKNQLFIVGVFVLFFLVLLIQHQFVFFSFDDYGYASLSYNNRETSFALGDYSISDILKYLNYHYFNVNGRIVSYFPMLLIMKFGMTGFRVAQSAVITIIFFLMFWWIQSSYKKNRWFVSLILVLLYGTISLGTLKLGWYWYSASAAYVWPFLPFSIGLICIDKYKQSNKKIFILFCCLCFGLTAATHEQMGILVIGVVSTLLIISAIRKNKDYKFLFILLAFSILGTLFVLLAPGNSVRVSMNEDFYALNILQKIKITFPALINCNFGYYNNIIAVLLSIIGFIESIILRKLSKKRKVCNILMFFNLIFLYYFLVRDSQTTSIVSIIFMSVWLVTFSANTIWLFAQKKRYEIIAIYLGGGASQLALLIVPAITERVHIIFEILLFVIMVSVLCEWLETFVIRKKILVLVTLAILGVSLYNFIPVLRGYANNYSANTYNDDLLSSGKVYYDLNENGYLVLHKLEDDRYGGIMPYQSGYGFMIPWLKNYYGYAQNVNFYWVDEELDQPFECIEKMNNMLENSDMEFSFDSITADEMGVLNISGWVINKNCIYDNEIDLVLKSFDGATCLKIPTYFDKGARQDLNLAFNDGNDYSDAGFKAWIPLSMLDLNDSYQLYFELAKGSEKYYYNTNSIFN